MKHMQMQSQNDNDITHIKNEMQERSSIEAPAKQESNTKARQISDSEVAFIWDKVAKNWTTLKSTIQSNWPELSYGELDWANADFERFITVIERRYGIEPMAAKEEVLSWLDALNQTDQDPA